MTSPQLCSSSTWWTLAIFFQQSGIKEILDFVYHLKSEQLEFQNFRAPCNLSASTPLDHWAVTDSFVVTWESSRHFAKPPLVFPQNDNWEMSGHSIQMMCYYANMGRASDWLKEISQGPQPFKSTTQIWVVTCHQYGISVQSAQTSFHKETRGRMANCQLISHANFVGNCS